MTETKIYCNHCKKEIDSMHDYAEIRDYANIKIEFKAGFDDIDLCVECYGNLLGIIKDFCTPSNTVSDNDVGNIKQQPVRYCEYCDKKGDVIYTSLPPKIKCAITGEYHDMHDVCNVQFK